MLGFLKTGEVTQGSISSLPVVEPNNEEANTFEGTVEELNESGIAPPTGRPALLDTTRANVSGESSRRKSMGNVPAQKAVDLINRASKLLETSNENGPIDDIDAFGLTVAAELRHIKDHRRCFLFRKQILDLIFAALEEEGF
nr:unnamed protein product [Callosobruchus analis]